MTQTRFHIQANDPTRFVGVGYTDRILSRANHQLFRQGRNYCIKVSVSPDHDKNYAVLSLRDDWMILNAWRLGFQQFLNNSKEELQVLGKNSKARWADYKVDHGLLGTVTEIYGTWFDTTAQNWAQLSSGEFANSVVQLEGAGAQREFHWGATSATAYGLLQEYDAIANTSSTPSTPVTVAAYQQLNEQTNNAQLEHLSDAGNLPPYNATSLGSVSPWTLQGIIGNGIGGVQNLSTPYFNAPCGLFLITEVGNFTTQDSQTLGTGLPRVFLDVKSGDYKGVHAPSMGTPKLQPDKSWKVV